MASLQGRSDNNAAMVPMAFLPREGRLSGRTHHQKGREVLSLESIEMPCMCPVVYGNKLALLTCSQGQGREW